MMDQATWNNTKLVKGYLIEEAGRIRVNAEMILSFTKSNIVRNVMEIGIVGVHSIAKRRPFWSVRPFAPKPFLHHACLPFEPEIGKRYVRWSIIVSGLARELPEELVYCAAPQEFGIESSVHDLPRVR